ncbi:c-type heme family protein [Raoultibacter timonensis]|uniref:ATP-binding protein n=1 Tax=Raoultibacter timonensis TaxID=1907662 RepID=UPI000C820371|nr:DUF3365 domain-containing protein [Raoultibacter timonensis]
MLKFLKNISLKTIYLSALTVAFAITFLMFAIFDVHSQQQQTEAALLEEARTFAREMDAVWQFMDNSQRKINYTSDGIYEFKGLHCAVVGKSVGTIFSKNNNYTIRYTNFNPRNYQGEPDPYESEALTEFDENSQITEYYGIADFEGVERFRYVQALEVDESCLECHGDPVGEIDITGHEKEGWTLDSVGGAISIVIPLDQQQEIMRSNVIRDIAYFALLTTVIGIMVYAITMIFVTRPLNRMKSAFGEMQGGSLAVALDERRSAKEISRLTVQFNDMAEELRNIYSNLEEQVADRTHDLREANDALERQRSNLEHLNEKLEKEMQFKSDLLSMVNHELRTPLTSIITFAQIARERSQSGDETERQSWEEIEKNSQILLGMINNMLDIARSDAGSVRATCEPMDLGDVVASVRSTIAPLARKYEVGFGTSVAPDVPLVNGDYEKVLRILENLGSNAVKFTPDGGEIHLMVECDRETGGVLIVMKDTGIGIAEEDQERIFERFFQVDSTSTRKYNGSGLGLALVREYAALQGFSVSVVSELGKGSSFIIRIPRKAIVGEDDV